ncbi:MAG: hypothetical protein SF066_06080 [Thermoanaerobaculia bacterium]|nr:hypothetical protein [Thermoanaerobaculia bacterium]
MSTASILKTLQGPFNFLRSDPEELSRLFAKGEPLLPNPQRIYLTEELATPRWGFPILLSESLRALREALVQFLLWEEQLQLGIHRRQPVDRKAYNQAWETYHGLLVRAVENVTLSSYGRQFPSVFWLHHSLDVATVLKDSPRRILRVDADLGRRFGDAVKYRIFDRFVDRVLQTTYDSAQRLAADTDEVEEELFPTLLTKMIENVLVFTEDHVSADLGELSSFFTGYLRIDGKDFRTRLEALFEWGRRALSQDGEVRQVAVHLFGADPERSRDFLLRPGVVAYLASRPQYNPQQLLDPAQVPMWESLLGKLKEFELIQGLRRLLVPVEPIPDGYVCRRPSLNRTLGRGDLFLSSTTRPLDFMAPWVVDPQVHRFGMIYDIAEFSEVVSVLRRSGTDVQDTAFRAMFRFQRKIDRLASARRLKLEKYLGDGAFYSSREAGRTLATAISIQRLYRQALGEKFPFDRGLRVALNFGQYRLIPVHTGSAGPERYEFFGHGLVELSRLTTGKAFRELEEIKTMLVSLGYREAVVQQFFAPLVQKNLDTVDKREEARQFYAYINANGNLVNEGIVATTSFLDQLDREGCGKELWRVNVGDRTYVAVSLPDEAGTQLWVGLRKLGVASLKGLDRMAVFEVIDLGNQNKESLDPLHGPGLVAAIERVAGRLGSVAAAPLASLDVTSFEA